MELMNTNHNYVVTDGHMFIWRRGSGFDVDHSYGNMSDCALMTIAQAQAACNTWINGERVPHTFKIVQVNVTVTTL